MFTILLLLLKLIFTFAFYSMFVSVVSQLCLLFYSIYCNLCLHLKLSQVVKFHVISSTKYTRVNPLLFILCIP